MDLLTSILTGLLGLVFNPAVMVVVVVLAIWLLGRVGPPKSGAADSGSLLRRIVIGTLVLFVGGLGICGGFGVIVGLQTLGGSDRQSGAYGSMFLGAGAIGLVLALLFGFLAYRLTRKTASDATVTTPKEGDAP